MYQTQLRCILLILIITVCAMPYDVDGKSVSSMNQTTDSAEQPEKGSSNSVFAKGIRGFWVTQINLDEHSKQPIIINFISLKIPPKPNNPPFVRASKFGTLSAVVNGKTCAFEVVTATVNNSQKSISVALSPFYRVNKKGKIRHEKKLNNCRALGLTAIDFYAIKPKLLGGSIQFNNGTSINTLFKPQGGAKLKLHNQKFIANNASRFNVAPPEAPVTAETKPHRTVKTASAKVVKPSNRTKPSGPTAKSQIIQDHAFTLKHPNYKTFHLPVYKGLPALVSNGLLSTGSKAAPSYQANFTPSNVQDWQRRFRTLRDFLDIVSIIDKTELMKWYRTNPKGENGGVPSVDVALAKRRADWLLERINKAFLAAADMEHIHKYFCPNVDMKSISFSSTSCRTFNGNPFEQRRLLHTFLDEVIPELVQYTEPLKRITRVAVLNWSLMSEYSFDHQGFVVQLFNDFRFYPFGEIVTTSSSKYGRSFKEKHAVFETMYIGPKTGLSGRGAHGAFLPMAEDEAEKLINKAKANHKRYASYITIELIPEDANTYKQRILKEKKLTSREYQYSLASNNVMLFLASQEGMIPLYTFPADVKPVK